MPEVPDTVDDAIEPLSSPSTDEVFEATRPFSAREIGSAAVSEALSGGGGSGGSWRGPCKVNAFASQYVFARDVAHVSGGTATGGSYRLSLGAEQTAAIAWDATRAQVVAALEALPAVGAGNVIANPRFTSFADIDSGHYVLFKELTATALLTGDGSGLTGPDEPYEIAVNTDDMLIEMFTPAVGDIILDFFHVSVDAWDGSPRLSYTDAINKASPEADPSWAMPISAQGVDGLDLGGNTDDYQNFSGLAGDPGTTSQMTAQLALIGQWAQDDPAHHLYTNLPALVINSVPVYSLIRSIEPQPSQGEVWIYVNVVTPTPLMD